MKKIPWVNLGKLLLTVALCVILFKKVGVEKLGGTFSRINAGFFLMALVLSGMWIFLKVLKWYYLVKSCEPQVKFQDVLKSFLCGFAFGVITPGKVGELGRIAYIRNGDRLRLAGLVAVDRFIDFVIIGLFSIQGAFYVGKGWGIGLACISLAGVLFLFSARWLTGRFNKGVAGAGLFSYIKRMVSSLDLLRFRLVLLAMGLTAGVIILSCIQGYLLLASFKYASWGVVFLNFPLIFFSNVIPLTIGNLGVREGAAVFLLGRYGIPPEVALNSALLLFLVNTLIPALVGGIFILIPSSSPLEGEGEGDGIACD